MATGEYIDSIKTSDGTSHAIKDTTSGYQTAADVAAAIASKADLIDGKIPSSQLPAYVDDVLTYASVSAFPATGETGKIYIAENTNKTYRWSGSAYTEISASIALGETSSTAYRGDRGKIAYNHSQNSTVHVTADDKSTWNGKQDAISDLATIRSGASAGTTAIQPNDNISELTNDAGYLTSYTESDPVFGASAAAGITASDISSWNSKVSDDKTWNGKGLTTDSSMLAADVYVPQFTSTSATSANLTKATKTPGSYSIAKYDNGYLKSTTPSASDSSTKVATTSWVSGKGYLTSFTESDPVFGASAAAGISSSDISAWNAKQNALTNSDAQIQSAVTNSHTHSNKTILDSIPSSGTSGYVLKKTSSGTEWGAVQAGDSLPSQSGNSGKFLTTNGSAASWAVVPDEIYQGATAPASPTEGDLWIDTSVSTAAGRFMPAGGTTNQVLAKSSNTDYNVAWSNISSLGAVPTSRTINGHALTSNVVVDATDVGAVPLTRKINNISLISDITLVAADLNAVPTTRTINGKNLGSNITLSASDVGAAIEIKISSFNPNNFEWDSDIHSSDTDGMFPYRCTIPATNATPSMMAEVTFGITSAMSGLYAPITECGNDVVYIWASDQTNPTILSILLHK